MSQISFFTRRAAGELKSFWSEEKDFGPLVATITGVFLADFFMTRFAQEQSWMDAVIVQLQRRKSQAKRRLACLPSVLGFTFSFMDTKPEITAYLKTTCGWSNGVRAVLAKYNLPYTEKDILQNPAFRWEMEQKSGQPLSPCVEVNGRMLPDISGEELESYLLQNRLVGATNATTNVPLNAPCTDEQHEAQLKFKG
jgi:monothiol glutaredoxin